MSVESSIPGDNAAEVFTLMPPLGLQDVVLRQRRAFTQNISYPYKLCYREGTCNQAHAISP